MTLSEFIAWQVEKSIIASVWLSSFAYLTDTIGQIHSVKVWRRGQVAKAADCKSAIVGSTPTDASHILREIGRFPHVGIGLFR